ncbi:hypothetical protein VTO73DRAFT_15431 [Trametes versicolor]
MFSQNVEVPQFHNEHVMQELQFTTSNNQAGYSFNHQAYESPESGRLSHIPPNGLAHASLWPPVQRTIMDDTTSQIVTVACIECRRIKKKCDNGQPCEPCRKKGYECIRPARRARQGRVLQVSQSATTYDTAPPGVYGSAPQLPILPQEIAPAQTFREPPADANCGYITLPYYPLDFDLRHRAPSMQFDYLMGPSPESGAQYHPQIHGSMNPNMSDAGSESWPSGTTSAPFHLHFASG